MALTLRGLLLGDFNAAKAKATRPPERGDAGNRSTKNRSTRNSKDRSLAARFRGSRLMLDFKMPIISLVK